MKPSFFEILKAGLEEAIAHQERKINLRTESIEITIPLKTRNPKTKTKCDALHKLTRAPE